MAGEKKDKTIGLDDILLRCRNILRGKVDQADNRNAVMGLVFLKFADEKFEAGRKEIEGEAGAVSLEEACYPEWKAFYLREEARWSYLAAHADKEDIAIRLDLAMEFAGEDNPPLAGALPQGMFAGMKVEARALGALVGEIGRISGERFRKQDLIGRVYEYFLQSFAIDARSEKGEFYTPKSIARLIAELVEPCEGKIYDPCCGAGGMLVQAVKYAEENGYSGRLSVYGQESNPATLRLAKMNLAIRGISYQLGEENASTFTKDQHPGLKADYIMANPPFNLRGWRIAGELTEDPRWEGYAVPPVGNANYAWILHMLEKLEESRGVAGFLLANSALGADGEEYRIRRRLIENDKVEAVFVLPRDMFYSTDISVTLWLLRNDKGACERNGRRLRDRRGEILFADFRRWNENRYEKRYVMFDERQRAEIRKIYFSWQSEEASGYRDVPELCRSVGTQELSRKNYSLAPSKYIEFTDREQKIDYEGEMEYIRREMNSLLEQEKASQMMLEQAFERIGYGLTAL